MPDGPRLFQVGIGIDLPKALVAGLETLLAGAPPEAWGRVTLILNTQRMARRIRDIFDMGPPRLLPRVLLLNQIEDLLPEPFAASGNSSLARRLELARFVGRLQSERPDLGPQSARFELADSLAALMEEMQGEGVEPGTVAQLDVSNHSEHYAQTQAFLGIVETYLRETEDAPEGERRQRLITQALIEHWQASPPKDPIILAGSTASRGTTRILAEFIATLDQGYVVLPGFDTDLPESVWAEMDRDALPAEDHPQYRFRNLMNSLGLSAKDVAPWAVVEPLAPARNRLASLALRPAPVTDAWRSEGPGLGDLMEATKDVTLIEAESPRAEALTIAMRLRQAAEEGQTAALITPDRMLTRQVAAALDQWHIEPDDSAGLPLHLSPAGRFLRHTAELLARPLTGAALLTLLKHPLTHRHEARNQHQLNTLRLEVVMRRDGMPFPDAIGLKSLGTTLVRKHGEEILPWLDWVTAQFCDKHLVGSYSLTGLLETHMSLSEAIAGPGSLWTNADGEAALAVMNTLARDGTNAEDLTPTEYGTILHQLLAAGQLRESTTPHPGIMIWGTLEARVQGADLVIMGSLNDGTWPEQPQPDPWLNRALRHDAGLLLPDRRVGLSAHDFQQAFGAKEVWLTRAIRSSDAETVPSRWVNRIVNLLSGLSANNGPEALDTLKQRGQAWLDRAKALEDPVPAEKAKRPSPSPPLAARPRELSVSDVVRLIRDPYAVYAKHVLGLSPVGVMAPEADAILRGNVFHDALEAFVRETVANPTVLTQRHLMDVISNWLRRLVPWPAARTQWQARMAHISDWFIEGEVSRQSLGQPVAQEKEARGRYDIPNLGVTVTARADRIDATEDGQVIIYDYKTGTPPSEKQQKEYDKQLLIEAVMAENGAFPNIGARPVLSAEYIGLGATPKVVPAPIETETPQKVAAELAELIRNYLDPHKGFTARRALERDALASDYDELSRFGEWDTSEDPAPEDLT